MTFIKYIYIILTVFDSTELGHLIYNKQTNVNLDRIIEAENANPLVVAATGFQQHTKLIYFF